MPPSITIRDTGDRRLQFHIADTLPRVATVETSQRNGGHAHFVSIFAREKPQPEHLEPVRGSHAIQFFVDRAHQHLPPETLDGARRLALLFQPVEHGDAVEIGASPARASTA